MSDAELSDDQKKALLDQIAALSSEALADPKARKPAVAAALLRGIQTSFATVTAAATAWKALEPILRGHFGLPM